MRRFQVRWIIGLTLIGSLLGIAGDIAPSHDAFRYVGRFTDDFRFGWTGAMVEFDFKGSELSADFDRLKGPAALTIVVDGKPHVLLLGSGRQSYEIASGLDAESTHRVVFFKRSEGAIGEVQFHGIRVSDDAVLSRPADRDRKMLVIGDSITCGYGNEAQSVQEGNTVENENGYMSYAPIAARELNADLMMFCWSGRGMFRNRQLNEDQATTIPKIFNQTLPKSATPVWDHSAYVPDVIVINLGTNDMAEQNGKKQPLSKANYVAAYTQFLIRLRGDYPDAKLVLSIGPMAQAPVSDWLVEIASDFSETSVLVYTPFSGPDEKGGHHHPSVKKDLSRADALVNCIRENTDWND